MSITSKAVESDGPATLRVRAERLRKRSKDLGFGSVAAMATRFGISRQHMYKILDGTYLPSVPTAQRMATELEMPIEDLFEDA